MNGFEAKLREMMHRRSEDVSGTHLETRVVLKRSKHRRIVQPLVLVLLITFSGAAAAAALSPVGIDRPQPAGPSPAPTRSDNPGPYELGDDPETGRVEVATGEYLDLQWVFYVKEVEDEWCSGLDWDGGGFGCPASIPTDSYVSSGRSGGSPSNEGGVDSLEGRLDKDVTRVEIRVDGDEPFSVPVLPGPEQVDVNFFVAFVPSGATGEIAVFDDVGRELEVQEMLTLEGMESDLEIDEEHPSEDGKPRCGADRATVAGTEGDDVLQGTTGQDIIVGLGGNDIIDALEGGDVVCGGAGDDVIEGGDGPDLVLGDAGDDRLNGGSGPDTLGHFNSTSGVRVDRSSGTSTGDGSDAFSDFEVMWGTGFNDVIVGDEGPDQIQAGDGDDRVVGMGGDDILLGEAGDDEIEGGDGRDLIAFYLVKQGIDVDLSAGTATGEGTDSLAEIEVVNGSDFDDRIAGGDGNETLAGGGGNDVISGGSGDDVLWGDHAGLTSGDYRTGGAFMARKDDRLDGGPGRDELHGGPGDNSCAGGEQLQDC